MTEFARAVAFEEALREQGVDQIVPFRWGDAVLTTSLPRVWDFNLLRVTESGASAAELAAEADRIQGDAGIAHRRVAAEDENLVEGFAELEWETNRFVFMAYRGAAAPFADRPEVREVSREILLPIREALVREAPWADDEVAVRQVLAAGARVAQAARPRHFAVQVDGEMVSAADLYTDGATAQVEDVVTLAPHRNQGYASAVILHAVDEAVASGHDFVFLVADDEDWPKDLYARLGFEPIGRRWTFQRRPPTEGS
jgi:GNAT superfamily N-acetyltransferase